ncbi:uncharacterized protein FIBRA_07990 [Fibroporia radiculosa]|uniref:CBM21 domain-containing protein n=1 Tax=Fibroporia radiculosa TaxID=599839 RepID=J4GG47_9APHY|nr:uncharacterized protein FIBRA_07990 [Fibroporia radiculosa]CCM05758.1 predicted protein [Fibroporia radiculosa]
MCPGTLLNGTKFERSIEMGGGVAKREIGFGARPPLGSHPRPGSPVAQRPRPPPPPPPALFLLLLTLCFLWASRIRRLATLGRLPHLIFSRTPLFAYIVCALASLAFIPCVSIDLPLSPSTPRFRLGPPFLQYLYLLSRGPFVPIALTPCQTSLSKVSSALWHVRACSPSASLFHDAHPIPNPSAASAVFAYTSPMSTVSLSTFSLMDPPLSRHSNGAGAPLPRIPKRTVSASRSSLSNQPLPSLRVVSYSTDHSNSTPPALAVVESPALTSSRRRESCSRSSGSSGSSDSPVQFLVPRRPRSGTMAMRPPEQSTPTPAVFRARAEQEQVAFPLQPSPTFNLDTPRASTSRLGPPPRSASYATTFGVPERSQTTRPEPAARTVSLCTSSAAGPRKPLKSSLKSRRTHVRDDLSVVTEPASSSRSEPCTPTHIKSVHFDSQLEHVKLFLAEQKPLAVSRDGSPTTDTSGTESDFPTFIFGEDRKTALSMEVPNMPAKLDLGADVALEELLLSADKTCLNGRVRVRNIAFEKWVAVRFTLDWWQTTSEVTAKYVQTLEEGKFDVFAFTIRLNDMLARIEEKTLFLAIRYRVTEREVWDNNGGENYHVKFTKSQVQPQSQSQPQKRTVEVTDAGIADLKSKLEKVAIGTETVGGPLRKSSKNNNSQFDLRSNTSLSSRYDFSASLKAPWKVGLPTSPTHSRTSTYPATHPPFHQLAPRPLTSPTRSKLAVDPPFVTRGSPRIDADYDHMPSAFYAGSDSEDTPSSTPSVLARRRGRNHQRGYFELSFGSKGARKSFPASLRDEAVPRYNSVDTYHIPTCEEAGVPSGVREEGQALENPWGIERGGSEESTPSITSTSESSRSSSPSGSPVDESVMFNFLQNSLHRSRGSVDDANYNVFLDR